MDAKDVRTVGIVGCGLMGSGIVEVVARDGHRRASTSSRPMASSTPDATASRPRRLARSSAGSSPPRSATRCSRASRGSTEVAALADVDLVIEAATEDPEIKLETFRKLDEVTRDDVVLASNTSSIPIATLGAVTGRPDRVIGMHFFNPPPVMALVELTPSLSTSDETLALARGFGERLGKTVVVAKDHAGFIVNRLVIPYLCAAIGLLDEGFASREDIDAAMTLGMNHPMGPLRAGRLHRARHRAADRRGAARRVPRSPIRPAGRDCAAWSTPATSARRPAGASTSTDDRGPAALTGSRRNG